jgi:NAD(P)-dependent dehydrogenase (short-subunit alcohol dehydrogenase family)
MHMRERTSEGPPEVVVITGAAAGVGRATAAEFGRRGAYVGLIARDGDRLERASDEIRRLGGRALILPTDVSDSVQIDAAAAQVEQKLGPIDIWVNDAMVTVFSEFVDITPEEFRRVTEVTYLGVVWGTMAALKFMSPRDRGCIVQVGSALAYRSIPLQSAYCGAKAAIRGFTDSLRTELLHKKSNIHLTMVQLPAVNTPQFDWCRTHLPRHPQPVPPIFDPRLPARAIVWASHQRRRELYLGLPTFFAIEANKFVPGLLDRYLARTGFASQQTSERVSADRPDNLFKPVHGDFNARGSFKKRARHVSAQFWLTKHRVPIELALTGLGLTALMRFLRG